MFYLSKVGCARVVTGMLEPNIPFPAKLTWLCFNIECTQLLCGNIFFI